MTQKPDEVNGPEFVAVKGTYWGNLAYHFFWLNEETVKMESAEQPNVEQIRRNLETMTNTVKAMADYVRI